MRVTSALAALLVVLLASGGAASLAGFGPLADASSDLPLPGEAGADRDAHSSGGDGAGAGGSGDGDGAAGDDAGSRPFSIQVAAIDECGETCRDVTLSVANQRNRSATGVTVRATIYAGKSTDDDDRVWAGRADLGSLDAGESVRVTQRVELGLMDAAAVKRADGWVTVRTTVTADGDGATFTEEKQVA